MGNTAQSPSSKSGSKTRVLVVDDETYIQHVVSLKLSNAGFEVLTACDGEEGLQTAIEELPDLIITDYQMPFLTGLEMCQRLKQNANTASIPVIMLTARGFALDDADLRSVSILKCLGKPFSPRELVACAVAALGAKSIA